MARSHSTKVRTPSFSYPSQYPFYLVSLTLTSFRVINALKKWVETYYDDEFAEDTQLRARLIEFIDQEISKENMKWAAMLKELLKEKVSNTFHLLLVPLLLSSHLTSALFLPFFLFFLSGLFI
jgi:hypothetical protein